MAYRLLVLTRPTGGAIMADDMHIIRDKDHEASQRTTTGARMPGVMDTFEDNWWRDNYAGLEGLQADRGYDHYQPAFRYGWQSYDAHRGKTWNDVEPHLASGWDAYRGDTNAKWDDAKRAVRHAFERAAKVFR